MYTKVFYQLFLDKISLSIFKGFKMCAVEYYTYDDYKQWKGDWELIYGQAVSMSPSPIVSHQAIAFEIAFEMKKNLSCQECMVVLEEDWIIDEDTVLRPDISLICNETGDFITKAPKIIIEVVSKHSSKKDEKVKFEIYEREKVDYYILAYPNHLKAKVFHLEDKKFDKVGDYTNEILVLDKIECHTKIDFNEVFKKFRK